MAIIVVPFSSNPDQVTSYSLPNAVSLAVSDDGNGGSAYINGLGILDADLSGAIDLRTVFEANGALFRSYLLLSAFRLMRADSNAAAENQLVPRLHISIYPLPTGGTATLPKIGYLANLGPIHFVPFIQVQGPGASGDWRLDISLRHSVTN